MGDATSQTRQAATLYHVPRFISSACAQLVLELGLSSDQVAIEFKEYPTDLKSAEYLAINPHGSAPCLKLPDGTVMLETGAIMTYLVETYDISHNLQAPPGSPARSRYLYLLWYALGTVYPLVAPLFLETLKPEGVRNDDAIATKKDAFASVVGPLLEKELGGEQFMVEGRLTAVDIALGKPLNNAKALGLLEGFPTLQSYFERLSARDAFKTAFALH